MKITTAGEMREIDRVTTEKFGVPSLTLMENAGSAVARFVMAKYSRARRFTIVCGKGNNGGDGFVVARKLSNEGKRVVVILLCEPTELKGDAAEMFRQMKLDPVVITSTEQLNAQPMAIAMGADVIIDAILGTGFRPPVTGLYAAAIAKINAARKPVVAVDIPSGADADATTPLKPKDGLNGAPTPSPVIRADHIVTFTAPRPAHLFANLTHGETLVAPIGSPEEVIQSELKMQTITPRDFARFLADREPEGHKGTYGHALVIGGSFGKCGAAAMAGISALRSGAGLSTIATPKSVLNTVAGFAMEIMTEPLPETDEGTIALAALEYGRMDDVIKGMDVVGIGPGVGRQSATAEFVRSFVEKYSMPLVIDADGLNAFDGHAEKLTGRNRPLVLTPHPGEMARLTGLSTAEIQKDRIGIARKFVSEHQCILVLKGHRTLVALPDGTVWVNVTGNPGMASGGSGDVLTGMVAGMMAQAHSMEGEDRWAKAVIAAVYLHGLAGDVAREKMGEQAMIAGDLIANFPEAFKRAKQSLKSKGFAFQG